MAFGVILESPESTPTAEISKCSGKNFSGDNQKQDIAIEEYDDRQLLLCKSILNEDIAQKIFCFLTRKDLKTVAQFVLFLCSSELVKNTTTR